MYQGVLFDMDGVLFDTERLASEADVEVGDAMGYPMPQSLINQLIGANSALVKSILMGHFGAAFPYDEYVQRVRAAMDARIEADGLPIKPGAETALKWLQAQNIPAAVASSSRVETVKSHLARSGFAQYFTAVIGGDMVQNSKPAPDIFIAAAKALGLAPAQCIAVEDSHNGIRSAAAAGCHTVMIPDSLPDTEEMRALAKAVLPSLLDLPPYVEALTAN